MAVRLDAEEIDLGSVTSACVLTADIVDFSLRDTAREQTEAVQVFIKLLQVAIPKEHNQQGKRIWSPAGDGGSLTFIKDLHAPLDTALNLARLVKRYNEEGLEIDNLFLKKPSRSMHIRIGIHSGPVSMHQDFDDRINVWGNGINMSARLIGLARPGQILISEEYFTSAELKTLRHAVRLIGKGWVKHNKSLTIYNVHDKDAGIPFDELGGWFDVFQQPLRSAARIYRGMLAEEYEQGKAPLRIAMLAKRILDLEPFRTPPIELGDEKIPLMEIITSLSTAPSKRRLTGNAGRRPLYDEFFSPLSPSAITYLFRHSIFEAYNKDEVIVKEGDKADRLMIIISGEIGVYRNNKKLRVIDAKTQKEIDVAFKDGSIVGEMGIFDQLSKRNATLKAERSTIVLSLDYEALISPPSDDHESKEDERGEIRQHIWTYYCNRTIDNRLSYHPFLQALTEGEKSRLVEDSTFIPKVPGGDISLSKDELWDFWIFVVKGRVTIHIGGDGRSTAERDFNEHDFIGPLRLVLERNPYVSADFSDAEIILVRYEVIYDLTIENELFRNACAGRGVSERVSLGIK